MCVCVCVCVCVELFDPYKLYKWPKINGYHFCPISPRYKSGVMGHYRTEHNWFLNVLGAHLAPTEFFQVNPYKWVTGNINPNQL